MGLIESLARRVDRWRGIDKQIIDAEFTPGHSQAALEEVYKRLPPNQANPLSGSNLSNLLTPLPLYLQYQRVGGQLTPLQVSSILQSTDNGFMYQFCDLANEQRQKDNHLQAILGTREISLSGLPYRIKAATKPGAEHPTARAESIANFCEHALKNAEGYGQWVKSFTDCVSHLAGGIYFGYGVSEIDWKYDGQQLVPRGFRLIPPRRFRFRLQDGQLVWWDSHGMTEEVDIQERWPDKFVLHQPRVNGDANPREGLARVLVWAALFRTWSISDWLKLAELSWKPWRKGVYKNTASKEDIADLVAALDFLTTAGYATHSDRVQIDVEWPQGGRGARSQHRELCEFLAAEMSKCVLGQTLTTQEGERGARSLGEVHDRVRKDVAESDAVSMASTIRRDIIAPLVRQNFGGEELIPTFEFVTEDTPDLGTFARGVQSLVMAGVKVKQDWVRDKIGAPNPAEDDDLCLGQQALVFEEVGDISPAAQGGGEGGKTDDKKDDEESGGSSGAAGGE